MGSALRLTLFCWLASALTLGALFVFVLHPHGKMVKMVESM